MYTPCDFKSIDDMLAYISQRADLVMDETKRGQKVLVVLDRFISDHCYKLARTKNLQPIERTVLARTILEYTEKRNLLVAHIKEINYV